MGQLGPVWLPPPSLGVNPGNSSRWSALPEPGAWLCSEGPEAASILAQGEPRPAPAVRRGRGAGRSGPDQAPRPRPARTWPHPPLPRAAPPAHLRR